MKKLAIIVTHPVQYYAPLFQLLNNRQKIEINVFYTWGEGALNKHDPGFGKTIDWDLPLMEGYPYQWVKNTSVNPGSHNFKGIINPDLNRKIETWAPDMILVFGWAYDSHLKVLQYFKNKILILFRGDSTLVDEKFGFKSLLKFAFLRWVYRHVDYAFYTGVKNKAYFKQYGLKEKQLFFAPHAIDNDRFEKEDKAGVEALRKTLGLKESDVLVLFAGKFEEKKDPLTLINCFNELNHKTCHLLLVGNGHLEKLLKEKATGHKRIHFMDFQNQSAMPVAYQACDLFCLPSKGPNETWGLAVNEAMAAGKAVLVSDKAGCAADLVKGEYNGLIFTGGDANSLKAGLKNLVQSKSRLKEMGTNSKELIKDWNFISLATAIENKLLNEKE